MHQDRTEPVTRMLGTVHESLEWFRRILQTLDVGNVTAELQHISEPLRGLLTPVVEAMHLGQALEGIVDLYRVEISGIVFEPAPLR